MVKDDMGRGKYVVFEGPDGTGKSYFLDAVAQSFRDDGRQVFDVNNFWKKNHKDPKRIPASASALYLSEPSYAHEGFVIREHLIGNPPEGYSEPPVRYIAEAFARDRARILEHLVWPALQRGLHVISSRNFLSSFAYQPIQAQLRHPQEQLLLTDLQNIPGNRLALTKYQPDLVVICTASESVRQERMAGRSEEEKDNATTERADISARVANFYAETAQPFLEVKGFDVEKLSLDGSKEDSVRLAQEYYQRLFR